jgi:hypothetical protein
MMDSQPATNREFSPPLGGHFTKAICRVALFVFVVGSDGCFLFHHGPSTQQKFVEALERGDSPRANQIWLNMNEQERSDWSHSIGMKPTVSKEDIETQLMRHAQQKADENGDDSSDVATGSTSMNTEEGNIESQMIEMPGIGTVPGAGGLQSLPGVGDNPPGQSEPMVNP